VPFYEYRCEKGHTFEVRQSMTDDPVSECEKCGRPVQRVFHPVAVHFKGSGFYNTDYGRKGSKAAAAAEKGSSSESKSESKSSESKASDSKSESKASASD
jgi:putative FmdB family regulatory protein